MKIKNIIEGWKNWFHKRSPAEEALFDVRLKQCQSNECGKLLLNVCTACGCPVATKVRALDEECPENMWEPILYEENGIHFFDSEELPSSTQDEFIDWMISKVGRFRAVKVTSGYFHPWEMWQEFKEYLRNKKDE